MNSGVLLCYEVFDGRALRGGGSVSASEEEYILKNNCKRADSFYKKINLKIS